MSSAIAQGPTCTWVAVVDETGRTHMEARWVTPAAPVIAVPHAA